MLKKLTSITMAVILCLSVSLVQFVAAEETTTVHVRIEGISFNLFYGEVSLPASETATAKTVLEALDKSRDDIVIDGLDTGYITAVNLESAGTFGGWDGWMYLINGKAADVGIADCNLSDGDSLVLYYGDYPCQIPEADLSKLSEGVITFTSKDLVYDASGTASVVVNPVVAATVTLGYKLYVTDEAGKIQLDMGLENGSYPMQIAKKSASPAPAVLRFAPDYQIEINWNEPSSEAASLDETEATVSSEPETAQTQPTQATEPVRKNPSTCDR